MIEPLVDERPRKRSACTFASIDVPNLICAIVCAVLWGVSTQTKPNPLYVPANDSLSSFPKRDAGLPFTIVTVFVAAAQTVLAFGSYFLSARYPTILRQCKPFTAIWICLTCFCFTGFVTNIFKDYVGRARPDFYAYCGAGATYETCQDKDHRDEEFRSWPSGHSSGSMSGGLFLTLFAQKVVRIQMAWVSVVSCVFVCLAVYVGCTRIIGFRHHPDDVMAGLFLGYVVTSVIWSRNWKDLFVEEPAPEPSA